MTSVEASGARPVAAPRGREFFLPYVMVAPAVVVAFLIAVLPLAYGIWLSFQDWYLLRNPTPVWGGLVNYATLFNDAALWRAFLRTIAWTVGTVIVEVAIGLPLALLLNRESTVSRLASALILTPWVTPFIVLGYGWRFLLDSQVGLLHHALQIVGIAGSSTILNDPDLALPMIIFISGWKGAPFMVIAILAALKSIPDELYEAAEVDGAGRWARFRFVTLPSIWNTIVIIGLVLGILAFYSFDLPWIMTQGGPGESSTILGIAMFKAVFQELRPAYAAAISVVMLVFLFVASLVSLRMRRNEA
jgi:ABC-type sugar transport system permease subunit